MKATTKAQQPSEAPKRRPGGQLYTQEEIETAIKRKFSKDKGRISIRHLWSDDPMHRFRVNWWDKVEVDPKRKRTHGAAVISDEEGIIHSRYLKVVADEEGIEITEVA